MWSFIPGVVLWTIWKTRNYIVFEGGKLDRAEIFFLARCRLASWFLARETQISISKDALIADSSLVDSCSSHTNRISTKFPWSPPPKGFIKLNVDAATSSDWKRSGLGGVLKDISGSILGSFKESAGPGPPTLMELKAILKGLYYYESIRHRFKERLIIESDSKVAIGWVKDVGSCPVVYVQVVKDIIQKLSVYEGLIRWVSRTANIEADILAKAGEVFYDVEEDFPMLITFDDDYDDGCFSIEDSFSHDRCDNLEICSATMDLETFEPYPSAPIGLYNRRKGTKAIITGVDVYCDETQSEAKNSLDDSDETAVKATEYRDVLILFRFDDRDLPFKLKQIITPDLRLLRLLEAGLPSWALFLQSYPGFCHIYRPWMCPLARALYVLISIITVLIGFFDLYKNVPLLKAAASHLCGPLLDWIENWEMVTRIKYLGTMLFLQNFEKAMHWLWVVLRASRLLDDFMDVVLMPIWFIISVLSNIATSVLYPMFLIVWEMLYAPIRLVLALASFLANVCAFIIDFVGDIWEFLSSMIEVASEAEATVHSAQEVSMWRSLWSDLLSQIFRALRSILYGFAAFFDACNRHRLSIYNHVLGFIQRQPAHGVPRSRVSDPGRNKSTDGHQYLVSNHMLDPRGVPFPYYGFMFWQTEASRSPK
ncbi:Ubiquitin-like family protein [Hibiscus syriacus]|uniref:Ubiquitin-like family protein n=1 Tax=Hibiscus syriacus TaxID=106335 RepID=A0A6A2ZVW7_HIBSY|nr:Ubiquitin-like family protein [Hibiscus syriacus]